MARKAKVVERHREVARALRRGATDREALLEAGYSEATSRKGIIDVQKRVPALAQAIHDESMQQARELIAKQDHSLSKAEMEQLVEAVLIRNSLDGEGDKKGSSYAAKLLGSLSRVNLFEPDMSVNPIFMTVPAEWRDRYSLEEAGAKQQPVDPLPPAEQKYLNGIPIHTTQDAIRNLQRQKALTEGSATPPQETPSSGT
ncbi:MAG: hypothetical protein IH793_06465 [Acidobacteria bacterium]|nr:hypothetical protein [Acidobacteriota bacterium]